MNDSDTWTMAHEFNENYLTFLSPKYWLDKIRNRRNKTLRKQETLFLE